MMGPGAGADTFSIPEVPQLSPRPGLKASDLPWVSLLMLALIGTAAATAPLIAPQGPNEVDLRNTFLPPVFDGGTWSHPLGTDQLGRDILSRLIWGSRISLTVSFFAIVFAGVVGTVVGMAAGYLGGVVDFVVGRLIEATLAIPTILMALALATIFQPSMRSVVIVIVLILWSTYARQARAETLAIKERDFVTLARVAGLSDLRIVRTHVLPNILSTLIVLAAFQVGFVVLLESSLGFLGLGVPPPDPSWGSMVGDGKGVIQSAWWISVFPGLAILTFVMVFNLLGDWLQIKLNPRYRDR